MKNHAILLLILLPIISFSQESKYTRNLDWDHERHSWSSFWITHPTESVVDYGVFLFRNKFTLDEVPSSFKVFVSADNRYRLFVNNVEVSQGPARGSLEYWNYETLDIAAFLKNGENVIASEVYNLGPFRPVAQFSYVTAFIFQSELHGDQLNTGFGHWKVTKNKAYQPRIVTPEMVVGKYYVAGPCDSIVGVEIPKAWQENSFNDNAWMAPKRIQKGSGRGYMHGSPWMLIPRIIPPMEQKIERFASVARKDSALPFEELVRNKNPLTIPPYSNISVLIDQKILTMGFPELHVSGGKGGKIKVTYSEALYDFQKSKGNRNETEAKEIHGYSDVFVPDGRNQLLFRPLWIRTFRFVQLNIQTAADALILDDYYFIFTAYPFEEKGHFSSDNSDLTKIWNVGWRTARLCALETYMDCPYWEQLQYLGDTRIQSLISLYVSGDDRLMRQALLTADRSRIADGLTMARGPSFVPQITPPFSLYWVDMVHDFFMHRDDPEFVRQFLPGIEAVIGWFERRIDKNGMLGQLEWFNFSDWTKGFLCGAPAGVDDGNSALISLNLVYALQRAEALFRYFGENEKADGFHELADKIRISVYRECFVPERGLLADTPLKQEFSQHTNIFGILTNTFSEDQAQPVMQRILTDSNIIQTTIYFKFYLMEALRTAGLGNEYTSLLQPWYDMLAEGLTTFEEGDFDDRSDCHAWGSSPLYHFITIVGGIRSEEPGFKKISISPAFGNLKKIKISLPHPNGELKMDVMKNERGKLQGTIFLPEGIEAEFKWQSKTLKLVPGSNSIDNI